MLNHTPPAPPVRIETERLIVRSYNPATDLEPFIALLADAETCRFIGGVRSRPEAWRSFAATLGHAQMRGYSFLALEEKASAEWIGWVGPWCPEGWPAKEVGWTVHRSRWGRGYATEAAQAALDHVFNDLGWPSVIHCIDKDNAASQGVARKLGSKVIGHEPDLAGMGMAVDLWGQTAADWRDRAS